MKAWYFSKMDCRLRHGDNRLIQAGITHTVDCEPIPCQQGLHASIRPINALSYAPDSMVWRVELGGEVVRADDKLCATERTYLWGYDATAVLRKFACMCALDVLPDDAPTIIREYLNTQDESKRVAACYAAQAAAYDAARAAAYDAAYYAAYDAAYDAARAAAYNAAYDALAEACKAARKKQNNRLYRMLMARRNA